jgi:hypothetical protein
VFLTGVVRVLSHCAPSDGRTVAIFGVSWTPPIESESISSKIVTDLPDRPRVKQCEAPWLFGVVARAGLTTRASPTDCTACICRELGAGLRTLLDAGVLTRASVC